MARKIELSRTTEETEIHIQIDLDGKGEYEINTGFKFMDHMLNLLSKHSNIDLTIQAKGDLTHHVIEDVGITLGEAFYKALGQKVGINRFGSALIPMDEALARCAIDLSGRKAFVVDLNLKEYNIEDIAVEDIYHFLNSFAENARMNLHLQVLYGEDQHHKVEAAFKALAISLKKAKQIISSKIPSTKGIL